MTRRLRALLIAAAVLALGAPLSSSGSRAPDPPAAAPPAGAAEASRTQDLSRMGLSAPPARPARRARPRRSRVAVAPAPGDARVDCSRTACVALTFDDGPNRRTTPRLLAQLRALRAHATFFAIGANAAANPRIVADEQAEGDVVGDHTWSHPDLARLGQADADRELRRAARTIRGASGRGPYLVRPPYGAWDEDVRADVARMGAAMVLWDVDSEDWRTRDGSATARTVLRHARRGSIVLLHDIYPSTVAAVPRIVRGLRARGLTPVTVPTLCGGRLGVGWTYYGQRDVIHPGTTRQTSR